MATTMSAAIGRVLAGEKTIARLSVRELAKRAGISYSVVNRMLTGEREMSAANFIRLCDALSVDPAWVLSEVERRENERRHSSQQSVNGGAPVVSLSDARARFSETQAGAQEPDWDTYEGPKAADYDTEADEDEPTDP